MVDSIEIYNQAEDLSGRFGTRNPEEIATGLGIMIYEADNFQNLLGMYTVRWKHRMIFINRMLEYYMRLTVIAHELGHDTRHRSLAKSDGMKEFSLFNMKGKTEYEANAFAAHLLLENDTVIELARNGYTSDQIAAELKTFPELVLIKIQEMNRMGYTNLRLPNIPDSCFLAKIKCDTRIID